VAFKKHYCVIDTETTGLLKEKRAEVIEVACMGLDHRNMSELSRFDSLVQPRNIDLNENLIPKWAQGAFNVHKIPTEELRKAPKSEEICNKLIGYFKSLSRPILVGQNLEFDILFLRRLFESCDLCLDDYIWGLKIDTYPIAHMFWGGDASMPNLKLRSVAEKTKVKLSSKHRAMGDVEETAEVFKVMSSFMSNSGSKVGDGKVTARKREPQQSEYKCPKCGPGYLVTRVAKQGFRAGNKFMGCSNFPECKFLCNTSEVEQYKK
jgi:DNA polymerase III epsilon subunit-like protein